MERIRFLTKVRGMQVPPKCQELTNKKSAKNFWLNHLGGILQIKFIIQYLSWMILNSVFLIIYLI